MPQPHARPGHGGTDALTLAVIALDLDVRDQPETATGLGNPRQVRQTLAREGAMMAGADIAGDQPVPGQPIHPVVEPARARERVIVDHDRLAVSAQLHVELHATDTERSSDLEACQRVLRRQGPAAAMGDHGG